VKKRLASDLEPLVDALDEPEIEFVLDERAVPMPLANPSSIRCTSDSPGESLIRISRGSLSAISWMWSASEFRRRVVR
jgi:hypothetical protein